MIYMDYMQNAERKNQFGTGTKVVFFKLLYWSIVGLPLNFYLQPRRFLLLFTYKILTFTTTREKKICWISIFLMDTACFLVTRLHFRMFRGFLLQTWCKCCCSLLLFNCVSILQLWHFAYVIKLLFAPFQLYISSS